MSKASEWAQRRRAADDERDFSWQRVIEVDKDRPTFVLREPDGYTRPAILTVGPDGQLSIDDMWVPRERALAAALWILETWGEDLWSVTLARVGR